MDSIAHRRLIQQRISQRQRATPAEVVSWLGAVQSQDYLGAKWSLGMRMQTATDGLIERAFSEGAILRTHVMRPTWHFVSPHDIRWLLELTGPHVNAGNATMYRRLELDEALFSRSNNVISKAVERRQLTREELAAALAGAGIAAKGLRLIYLILRAEIDALICSGPRRGKQFTYMLLDERAPQARRLPRDEALAELARRYFTGHGPATLRDFVWWSGLTTADAKASLDLAASQLAREEIGELTYWFSPSMPVSDSSGGEAFLLPTYDEFLIGYASFDKSRKGGNVENENFKFNSTIVINGEVMGTWKRTFKNKTVVIEIAPFKSLNASEKKAVRLAAQRYGEFLDMPVDLV